MDPSILLLLGFLAIMYFVMIRPQQKRQKQHNEMLSNLQPGDDVITIGGMHGRVDHVADDHIDLEVTDDIVLRYQKNAIAKVVTPPGADELEDVDADADVDDDVHEDHVEDAERS